MKTRITDILTSLFLKLLMILGFRFFTQSSAKPWMNKNDYSRLSAAQDMSDESKGYSSERRPQNRNNYNKYQYKTPSVLKDYPLKQDEMESKNEQDVEDEYEDYDEQDDQDNDEDNEGEQEGKIMPVNYNTGQDKNIEDNGTKFIGLDDFGKNHSIAENNNVVREQDDFTDGMNEQDEPNVKYNIIERIKDEFNPPKFNIDFPEDSTEWNDQDGQDNGNQDDTKFIGFDDFEQKHEKVQDSDDEQDGFDMHEQPQFQTELANNTIEEFKKHGELVDENVTENLSEVQGEKNAESDDEENIDPGQDDASEYEENDHGGDDDGQNKELEAWFNLRLHARAKSMRLKVNNWFKHYSYMKNMYQGEFSNEEDENVLHPAPLLKNVPGRGTYDRKMTGNDYQASNEDSFGPGDEVIHRIFPDYKINANDVDSSDEDDLEKQARKELWRENNQVYSQNKLDEWMKEQGQDLADAVYYSNRYGYNRPMSKNRYENDYSYYPDNYEYDTPTRRIESFSSWRI